MEGTECTSNGPTVSETTSFSAPDSWCLLLNQSVKELGSERAGRAFLQGVCMFSLCLNNPNTCLFPTLQLCSYTWLPEALTQSSVNQHCRLIFVSFYLRGRFS